MLHDRSFGALAVLQPDPRVSASVATAALAAAIATIATVAALTAASAVYQYT